jgi:hypothetical protein
MAPEVIIERMSNRGSGDIFVDDLCGQLNLQKPGQSAWCRQLNVEHQGTMCRNYGGRLWILGMKTEKVGTIIETVNGGVTDTAGIFIYSNAGCQDGLPAFVIENSTATLCGINERNYNRKPVTLWVRGTQHDDTRKTPKLPWVYLSRLLSEKP